MKNRDVMRDPRSGEILLAVSNGRSVATVTETNNMAAVPKTRWRLVKAITIHEII
jgi:hypothetical protein